MWNNLGKGVAAFPNEKEAFWSPSTTVAKFTNLNYIIFLQYKRAYYKV